MSEEIDLTPDFRKLFDRFHTEATMRARTLLADMDRDENGMTKRSAALRAFHELLVPLNICAQCATNAETILKLRDLLFHCMQTLEHKADADEARDRNDALKCATCGEIVPPDLEYCDECFHVKNRSTR